MSSTATLPSHDVINASYDMGAMPFDLSKATIMKSVGGSYSFGTATAGSDLDIRGVFIMPFEFRIGLEDSTAATYEAERGDATFHDLQKVMQLAAKMNDRMTELLFVPQQYLLESTDDWDRVVRSRDLFLSSRARFTYGRYALENISESTDQNSSHADLRQKNGYDTSKAHHAIRLLRMGAELLSTRRMTLPCPYADLLLRIKNGEMGRDEFAVFEERPGDKGKVRRVLTGGLAFEELQKFDAAAAATKLPEKPDRVAINSLLVDIATRNVAKHLRHYDRSGR